MDRRILLISGSLRDRSTNTAVVRTAAAIAPSGVACAIYDGLALLPAFNPDDEARLPAAAARLRAEIHAADALLFCTPEYAGALPGSVKNMLDWTIGDAEPGSIYDKPVAWINASARGAAGAHRELRDVLGYAHATVVDAACASVPIGPEMIGTDGLIADARARNVIAAAIAALASHARRAREQAPTAD